VAKQHACKSTLTTVRLAIAVVLAAGCGTSGESSPSIDAGDAPDHRAPAGGVGILSIGLRFDGSVGLGTYFAAYRDCDALPREAICQLRYAATCWPFESGTAFRTPNAGVITLGDGAGINTYAPNAQGLYTTLPPEGPLDPTRVLHIAAAGDVIPAFSADVSIPVGELTLTSPATTGQISRSAPLTVGWSGPPPAPADRVSILVQTTSAGARNIECNPESSSPTFEIGTLFTSALMAGQSANVGIHPASVLALRAGDWALDVVARGPGDSRRIPVVP
jgi:hypothetical protein